MMMRTILSALLAGLLSLSCAAAEDVSYERIRFERLPDMKTPRAGHLMLVTGNEITVFGGHTDGFNPVGTAESFRNGTWYSLQMSWPHDGGCFAVLPDGRVFLGGGSAESFGIGQSWGAEIYDPETHGFHPIGIMDRKRAYASALTLPDGKIVIAGNWYAEDGVALYDPGEGFLSLKNLPVGWNAPYILPASPDEAVIFGREDNYGNPAYGRVDLLRGDTLHVSLLEDWTVKVVSFLEENLKIADYTYLLPIERSSDGQIGILKVSEGHFSLLETDTPFPVKGPFGGPVNWTPWFQVKRPLRQAWMLGYDVKGRICLARIDYDATFDGGKADLRLFYAEDASGAFPQGRVCLMPDGSLLMSGGVERDLSRPNEIAFTNFQTSAAVYRFYPDQFSSADCASPSEESVSPCASGNERKGCRRNGREAQYRPDGRNRPADHEKGTLQAEGPPRLGHRLPAGHQPNLYQPAGQQSVGEKFRIADQRLPHPLCPGTDAQAS